MMDERGKYGAGTPENDGGSPPLEQLLAEIESESESTAGSPGVVAPEDAPVAGAEQYIRFVLDGVHFAIPLKRSLEVGRLPAFTPLPNLPAWVSGISNVRGEVVSLVDLKLFFGRGPSTGTSGRNMILLHTPTIKVGVRVDHLLGIVSLSEADSRVSANPFTHGDITPYLFGVVPTDASLLYLLDVEKLLSSEKMNCFRRA